LLILTKANDIHSSNIEIPFRMPDRGKQPERPSFLGYWKSSDSQDPSKQLTFVPYDDPRSSASTLCKPLPAFLVTILTDYAGGKKGKKHKENRESDVPEEEFSHARTESRRAQVRKAQIQHRQRKANYIQQLESDITTLNKDIEDVESESQRLAQENVAMKQSMYQSPHSGVYPYATAYAATQSQQMDPNTLSQWSTQGFDASADPLSYIADGSASVQDYSQWPTAANGDDDENQYYLDDEAGQSGYGYYYDHNSYYTGYSGSPSGRNA
jgi:hypothetical protein